MRSLIKSILGKKLLSSFRRWRKRLKNPKAVSAAVLKSKSSQQLHEIATFYGTDKTDAAHTFKGRTYIDIYESYFTHIREDKISFLEIGVKEGYSLETWNTYFAKGTIKGLDIDPRCKEFEKNGIEIAIGSQTDIDFLKTSFLDVDEFDVILDDGAHVNHMIKSSFEYLFYKRLKSGGLYIIEDLGCSYSQLQTDHNVKDTWPGMKYNGDEVLDNHRKEMDTFFNKIIHDLDHLRGEIYSIHFYSRICVITKA